MSANTALVRAHYNANAAGDLAGMLAPFSDDIRWTEAAGFPYAGTYVGPDAVVAGVFGRIGAEWDPFTVDIDDIYDGGTDGSGLGTVFAIGTYSGTYRSTGRSFVARVVHVWRIENNLLVAFEQFTDTAEVRAAID